MWNLKNDISPPKFYELLIKTELKVNNDLKLKNFYKHITKCINAVTRLREDLFPDYQSTKIQSEFKEYFIPDRSHPYYYWNAHTYTFLGHLQLVALNNYTCEKYSMATQAYKVVNTHANEISGWTILSRLLHVRAPNIGGMNGDVQYYLETLELKNVEQLEYLNSKNIRLQQEIIFSGEDVSPTRLLFQ